MQLLSDLTSANNHEQERSTPSIFAKVLKPATADHVITCHIGQSTPLSLLPSPLPPATSLVAENPLSPLGITQLHGFGVHQTLSNLLSDQIDSSTPIQVVYNSEGRVQIQFKVKRVNVPVITPTCSFKRVKYTGPNERQIQPTKKLIFCQAQNNFDQPEGSENVDIYQAQTPFPQCARIPLSPSKVHLNYCSGQVGSQNRLTNQSPLKETLCLTEMPTETLSLSQDILTETHSPGQDIQTMSPISLETAKAQLLKPSYQSKDKGKMKLQAVRRSPRLKAKQSSTPTTSKPLIKPRSQMGKLPFDLQTRDAPLDVSAALQILQASGLQVTEEIEKMIDEAIKVDHSNGTSETLEDSAPLTPLHDSAPPMILPGLDMVI